MKKKLSLFLVVVIFSFILIFLNSKGLLRGTGDVAGAIFSPVTTFFSNSSVKTTRFFSNIFNIGKLQRENADLSERLNRLEAESARLKEVQKENDSLRKDLGFLKKTGFSYEPASVIAYDPSNIRGYITVNKGSNNGIKEGMAAISEGFLVGKIQEVEKTKSKIMLITDPSSIIPVEIQGTSTSGIVKGLIGTGLMMEKIPQGDNIQVGDTVITSGLGGEIPRGVIVGSVKKIEGQENSLFTNALIQPEAKITNILRVLIITDK